MVLLHKALLFTVSFTWYCLYKSCFQCVSAAFNFLRVIKDMENLNIFTPFVKRTGHCSCFFLFSLVAYVPSCFILAIIKALDYSEILNFFM